MLFLDYIQPVLALTVCLQQSSPGCGDDVGLAAAKGAIQQLYGKCDLELPSAVYTILGQ